MKLVLDDQPIDFTETGDATLREVVERISLELKESQRVISEIVLDGRHIGGWDDPELSQMTVGQCQNMRLISEEPRNLAHKVLHEIASYMPRIKEALIETSSKIQSGAEKDGMQLLEQVTATWAELYQGFQSAILVTGLDLNMVTVEGRTFLAINEEIHKFLDHVTVMVQENRMLELSDVLEYEIAPRIPLVEEGIYRVIKEMEKKPN
ncbi:MAG: hypothetical protein P9L94_10310 [Candidatus Hinthialibacter antarcticus]|nr:hypothetical protein [Candidatus Hinthialibacter antarcticus]